MSFQSNSIKVNLYIVLFKDLPSSRVTCKAMVTAALTGKHDHDSQGKDNS